MIDRNPSIRSALKSRQRGMFLNPFRFDSSRPSSALLFGGADNSTVFTDEAGPAWAATGTAKIANDPSRPGLTAGKFDGSGYISTPFRENLDLSTGDWTLDTQIYKTANNPAFSRIYMTANGSISDVNITIRPDGSWYVIGNAVSGPFVFNFQVATPLPNNAPQRIRVCRHGGSVRLFLNGAMVGKATGLAGVALNRNESIRTIGGQTGSPTIGFIGFVQHFVLLKGVALYTDDLSPPLPLANLLSGLPIERNKTRGRAAPASPLVLGVSRFVGNHRITGDTKNDGTPDLPVGRLVRLHDQPSGAFVQEMWSDPVTGYYAFTFIASGVYCVSAFDHTLEFESELEAYVQSEPMS